MGAPKRGAIAKVCINYVVLRSRLTPPPPDLGSPFRDATTKETFASFLIDGRNLRDDRLRASAVFLWEIMGLRFASKITKIFAATTWLGIKKTKHSVNKSLGPHEIWRKEILLQSLGSKANRTLAMLTLRKIYAIGARLDELRSLYSAD